jgi:hypothetical protein
VVRPVLVVTEVFRSRRLGRILRVYGPAFALLATTVLIAVSVNRHYGIAQWLFWVYARCWALSLGLVLACAVGGRAALRFVITEPLPWRERTMFSLALGLLIFFFGMFLGGLLGLYGVVFHATLPLVMLAAGAWLERGALRRRIHRVPRLWLRLRRRPTLVEIATGAFGLFGLAMVYFLALAPDNTAFDSLWYHLALAEHYTTSGRVARFPEGWYQGTLPHLASFVYAWGFLLPKSRLFDRVELCAHLEFAIFLCTLFSVPVLVRWIAPRARAATSWSAMFLFSGIFLYDSSLTVAADHIAAFWTVPILVALRRTWKDLDVRYSALLGATMAGSALTKYQTMSVLAFPTCAVALRALWLGVRTRRLPWSGPVAALASGLALTAPHWLKNWVWYGDPLYPFLHRHLRVRPWTVDSANLFESFFKDQQLWRPRGTTIQQAFASFKAMFTFAFEPHDWITAHGNVPVFGFLLTAALLSAPFVRPGPRLWVVLGASHLGVFVWFWTSHQDRYLQILLPWMACAAAGALILSWRAGWLSRVAVVVVVALQAIWGGDVYFLPTHPMIGASPIPVVVQLLSSGYRKDFRSREAPFEDTNLVAKRLAPGSKLLVHEMHMHLGIRAPSVSDWAPWQGGISYGRLPSPRALHAQFAGYGVTHIWWKNEKSEGMDSLAGDFVFFEFAMKYTKSGVGIGDKRLARLPRTPPADRPWLEERAVVLLCPGSYPPGVYRLGDLTLSSYGPRKAPPKPIETVGPTEVNGATHSASFIATEEPCWLPPPSASGFAVLAKRGKMTLMTRRNAD